MVGGYTNRWGELCRNGAIRVTFGCLDTTIPRPHEEKIKLQVVVVYDLQEGCTPLQQVPNGDILCGYMGNEPIIPS